MLHLLGQHYKPLISEVEEIPVYSQNLLVWIHRRQAPIVWMSGEKGYLGGGFLTYHNLTVTLCVRGKSVEA
jgi:hypothetical protein